MRKLPTKEFVDECRATLKQFRDPNGCIDDAEELLELVPDYCEAIGALDNALVSLVEVARAASKALYGAVNRLPINENLLTISELTQVKRAIDAALAVSDE